MIMTKILIILGIIFVFSLLILGLGIRIVKGILKPFIPPRMHRKSNLDNSGDILYQKNEIVVMKGDAGKHRPIN